VGDEDSRKETVKKHTSQCLERGKEHRNFRKRIYKTPKVPKPKRTRQAKPKKRIKLIITDSGSIGGKGMMTATRGLNSRQNGQHAGGLPNG